MAQTPNDDPIELVQRLVTSLEKVTVGRGATASIIHQSGPPALVVGIVMTIVSMIQLAYSIHVVSSQDAALRAIGERVSALERQPPPTRETKP